MEKTCKKGLHKYVGVRCQACQVEWKRRARREAGIPVRECVYGGSKQEQRKRHRDSTNARHPDLQKNAQKRYREKVGLGYAAHTMRVRVGDLPVEILEAKAALIRLKRKLKKESNG